MRNTRKIDPLHCLAAVSALTVLATNAFAADSSQLAAEGKLDATTRAQLIATLSTKLENDYVFADKGAQLAQTLRKQQQRKFYEKTENAEQLAQQLTEQLQQLSGDKHLRVDFSPEPLPAENDKDAKAAMETGELAMWKSHNFGFEHVERLPFNIGYFKLSAFAPVKEAAPLIAATMNLLNNMDRLIIDLRGNFGGHEQTGPLLASYFLNERTHLLDMKWRDGKRIEQQWSSEHVNGAHFGTEKEVYILIDNDSFSAAEAFAYTMKHAHRATLVGEKTAGAANAGDDMRLSDHFSAFIPTHAPQSPVTRGNWEGTGVTPDIATSSEQALNTAQLTILKSIAATEKNPRRLERIKARITELQPN